MQLIDVARGSRSRKRTTAHAQVTNPPTNRSYTVIHAINKVINNDDAVHCNLIINGVIFALMRGHVSHRQSDPAVTY